MALLLVIDLEIAPFDADLDSDLEAVLWTAEAWRFSADHASRLVADLQPWFRALADSSL